MIHNGWYCCPKCGQKLFKVNPNAVVLGIEYKCKKCKEILKIHIEPLSLSND